jgi:serine phosphatase RsbU (regulator of sigma subunit)
MNAADLAEITLMGRGDILFLYTDGVYDGSDEGERREFERIIREHKDESAKDICNAILERATGNDERLRLSSEPDCIDDKTVFIVKSM